MRGGVPSVLAHLCIDCTCCIAVCDTGALGLTATAPDAERLGAVALAVPPAFLAGFGERIAAASVSAALTEAGFTEVRTIDAFEDALRHEVVARAAADERPRPVLSPVCPVGRRPDRAALPVADRPPGAVRLAVGVAGRRAPARTPPTSCRAPGQRSALAARGVDAASRAIEPGLLRDLALSRLAGRRSDAAAPPAAGATATACCASPASPT